MLARLKIGSAFRYSRNIVGELSGFVFSLGNIFKTPFTGKGPAIFMGSLGLSVFMFKARENYQLERPEISIDDYKKDKIKSSTVFIAAALIKDPQKFKTIHENNKAVLMSSEQKVKETKVNFSPAELENMLKEILNNSSGEDIVRKYIHCTATFLGQVGSHFMECLLAKTYDKSDLFDFSEFTADNILIVMLAALSLYNGYQSFKENHAAYEKAHIDDICVKFLRT